MNWENRKKDSHINSKKLNWTLVGCYVSVPIILVIASAAWWQYHKIFGELNEALTGRVPELLARHPVGTLVIPKYPAPKKAPTGPN
jgi:hypothetical protein